MAESTQFEYQGHGGKLIARRWDNDDPRYVVLLCHGYGEHIGRYEYLADRLVADGGAPYGVDHLGHGKSDGERVLITDFEKVVHDFRELETTARQEHPQLPVVLIGHAMGGMIGARYAQHFGADLESVTLSGPVLGHWGTVKVLLAMDEIPEVPIDITTLSRDLSVGADYAADPLVWHGAFKRPTLEAIDKFLDAINESGQIQNVPVQWLHGSDDPLVPYDATAEGWKLIAPTDSRQKVYPGARHEIFNETNKSEVVDDVLAFINKYR